MSDQNDGTSTEVRALKGMVEERTTQRDNFERRLRSEYARLHRIGEILGGDKDLETEHLAKAVAQELSDAGAQRDTYKIALESLSVDMEVLRDESREIADKLQEIKERLEDAERRPWWGDRPDETEIVAKVLRLCGVNDDVDDEGLERTDVLDEGFDRAALLVKGYFADQYPPDLRPDFPLKEGWNKG